MLDMPSVESLEQFKQEVLELKRGKRGNRLSPHKLILLLAVVDLMDRGVITENKIHLSPLLSETFRNIFLLVSKKGDWCQVGPPFFHLRTSGFWFHSVKPGHESAYAQLTTTGGGTRLIKEHIEFAYFREDVFEILRDPKCRTEIRCFLSELIKAS